MITIDELAVAGKTTKIHIVYLTKLGLLPHATKRKINGQMVGCYPEESFAKLHEIQQLKTQGLTYSQISKNLIPLEPESTIVAPQTSDFFLRVKPSNFAYLVLGLVIGVIVSTLNTSGLAAMNQTQNLPLTQAAQIETKAGNSDVYLIAVPNENLSKLDKTTINTLISN